MIIRICSNIPIYFQVSETEGLVTNKCLARDAFREDPRTTENLSIHIAVHEDLYAYIFLYSHIFYKTVLVSEPYWLPKCIAPYNMHLLTLERLTLHFMDQLVNAALKFYLVSITLYNFNF